MKSFEESFPIVQLRQFHFCPRIVWYQTFKSIQSKEKIWMRQGSDYHIHRELLMKKKILTRFNSPTSKIDYRVSVQSESKGIHGIADAIIQTEDEISPIEFKLNTFTKSKGILNQLFAYGLSLEEMFHKKFKRGFLIAGKNPKLLEIQFTDEDRKNLFETIEEVKKIMVQAYLPDSSASLSKCGQCEFLVYCNDREI